MAEGDTVNTWHIINKALMAEALRKPYRTMNLLRPPKALGF
jgi:hypothetical protein